MKTRGVSNSFAYLNLPEICKEINKCPQLEIKCENSEIRLQRRANKL